MDIVASATRPLCPPLQPAADAATGVLDNFSALPIEVASKVLEYFPPVEKRDIYHLALTSRHFYSFTRPRLAAARLYARMLFDGVYLRRSSKQRLERYNEVLDSLMDRGCQIGVEHKAAILSDMVWRLNFVPLENTMEETFLKMVAAVTQLPQDDGGRLLLKLIDASSKLKPADQAKIYRGIDSATHALSPHWTLACRARWTGLRRDKVDRRAKFESILHEMATLPPAAQAQVLCTELENSWRYPMKLKDLLSEHALEAASRLSPEERGPLLVALAKHGAFRLEKVDRLSSEERGPYLVALAKSGSFRPDAWNKAFHALLRLCADMPAEQKSVALGAFAAALDTSPYRAESNAFFHALLDESATLPADYRQWLTPKLMAGACGTGPHGNVDGDAITCACGKLIAQMRSPSLPAGAKAKLLAGLLDSFSFLPDNDDVSAMIREGMAEIASQDDDAKAALLSDVASLLQRWAAEYRFIRNRRNALALGALRLSPALPAALLAPLLQELIKLLSTCGSNLDNPLPSSMRELENFNTLVAAVARLPDTARQPMLERLNDLARHLPGDALREAARNRIQAAYPPESRPH